MENPEKKKVDEIWKDAVAKEKEGYKEREEFFPDEPTFIFFISTLGMQASIALGDIPNPISDKQEVNLSQAKFFIDTLSIIKEKTVNNLSLEEDNFLDSLLYELKLRFVAKSKDANKGEQKP
jgi:hypothetical protein